MEEKNEVEVKEKKKSKGFIVVTILLAVALICSLGYIGYDKFVVKTKSDVTTNEKANVEEKNNEESKTVNDNKISTTNSILGFDSSKCINSTANDFVIYQNIYGEAISLSLKENNTVNINVGWKDFIEDGWSVPADKTVSDIDGYTINNFSGKVVDIYTGVIGQDTSGIYIFFLLEDGTVEYMSLYQALQDQSFKSYGKIKGVEGVVKFYSVADSTATTVFAQKSDGTFYDLFESIFR